MRKTIVLFCLVFLASFAAANIVLEVTFGTGIQHNSSAISANVDGVPNTASKYYFTSSGVSTNQSDAFVVSNATATGTIIFSEIERIGDCSWFAYINGVEVPLANVNGHSVADNDEIKWSMKPNQSTVIDCKLVMDYNVVAA